MATGTDGDIERSPGQRRHLLFGREGPHDYDSCRQQLFLPIWESPKYVWMRTVLLELPTYAQLLAHELPDLASSRAYGALQDSLSAFAAGDCPADASQAPHAIVASLSVARQLAQYMLYSAVIDHGPLSRGINDISPPDDTHVAGLSTGLLAAVVVSISHTWADFQIHGAKAIRLAMLIGLVVGYENELRPRAHCLGPETPTEQNHRLADLLSKDSDRIAVPQYGLEAAAQSATQSSLESSAQSESSDQLPPERSTRWFRNDSFRRATNCIGQLCELFSTLRLLDTVGPTFEIRQTLQSNLGLREPLHIEVLESMLHDSSERKQEWDSIGTLSGNSSDATLLYFGTKSSANASLLGSNDEKTICMFDEEEAAQRLRKISAKVPVDTQRTVAVVGMSIKVAGSDGAEEFWRSLCKAESQHRRIPQERISTSESGSESDDKTFGNFMENYDTFDHRFFRKTPREAATMDPQQRLFLQCAYQAVCHSGCFSRSDPEPNVGVYVGSHSADYEDNISCHPPNAFSATGNLRAFTAGKISHHFGWTGPAMTVDSAHTSSTIAIHRACRAILRGECAAALAGGVTVIGSASGFGYPAQAGLLSSTGPCRPFDAAADGYCRGEGVACVLLKSTSQAIEDGDHILGFIDGTAVAHDPAVAVRTLETERAMTAMPTSDALYGVCEMAIKASHTQPQHISVIEACGTGILAGDEAEFRSIERLVGQAGDLVTPVALTSTKGLIGHTESASGVVSLVKVLLMMQNSSIPPQASFDALNPRLENVKPARLRVPKMQTQWIQSSKVALLSDYSVTGSIAAMVVKGGVYERDLSHSPQLSKQSIVPIWIAAHDQTSLREYSSSLATFLASEQDLRLEDVAYNLFRQSNRILSGQYICEASTTAELARKLQAFSETEDTAIPNALHAQRPVILCFGDEFLSSVSLDQELYRSTTLLRKHLDQCNEALMSIGGESIYPAIFENDPECSMKQLHSIVFAIQYASAKCWVDSGVKVAAVVGAGLGELTCLAITGICSLEDTARAIVGRVEASTQNLNSTTDILLAIEGDEQDVRACILETNAETSVDGQVSLAFEYSPRQIAIVGPKPAIERLSETLTKFSSLKMITMRQNCPFYSPGTQRISESLLKIGQDLKYRPPNIRWERASKNAIESQIGADFLAFHCCQPVYAMHAFERLERDYPAAVWLETSSGSNITDLASQALKTPGKSIFQSADLTSEDSLTRVFTALWANGVNAHHWAHHGSQGVQYRHIVLPPYQFRKSCHWLELKAMPMSIRQAATEMDGTRLDKSNSSVTFVGYRDRDRLQARFRINITAESVQKDLVKYPWAPESPLLPLGCVIDLVMHATLSLLPDLSEAQVQPLIENVEAAGLLVTSSTKSICLDVSAMHGDYAKSTWKLLNIGATNEPSALVTGEVEFQPVLDIRSRKAYDSYAQMAQHQTCVDVLESPDADDRIRGRELRRLFVDVLPTAAARGTIHTWATRGEISACRLVGASLPMDDVLCIGSFWANNQADRFPETVYTAYGLDVWHRTASHTHTSGDASRTASARDVLAYHRRLANDSCETDLFVFEAHNGRLVDCYLGVRYERSEKSSVLQSKAPTTRAQIGTSNKGALKRHNPIKNEKMRDELAVRTAEPDTSNDGETASSAMSSAFQQVRLLTDQYIVKHGCNDYLVKICPLQTRLCVTLALEAFEQLGCDVSAAKTGSTLRRIDVALQHEHLLDYLYDMLEHDAGLISIDEATKEIVRTTVAAPSATSNRILANLEVEFPEQVIPSRLTYHCGRRLAEVLRDDVDGLSVIFGSLEGRKLVAGLYGDSPLNVLTFQQTAEVLRRTLGSLTGHGDGQSRTPFRILEMGAGTGGATKHLLPVLESVTGAAVEYTFTDVASSFVGAASRKRWLSEGVGDIVMKFRTHDIVAPPAPDLVASQDLIIAANAVHATPDLTASLRNMREFLRPGGCLMLVEMTEPLRWVDMVFGLLKDWWAFDDGRQHALASCERWETALTEAGFGLVDWSDGELPETGIQRLFFAARVEE